MRRYLLRAFIALFAFAAGVTVATLFGARLGLSPLTHHPRPAYISSQPRSCPSKQPRFEAPLPPLPPEPPLPPDAPAPPNAGGEMRFSVRLPDGSVRVIEMKTDEKVEQRR